MQYRGVIWTKTIIVDEDAKAFYRAMGDAVDALEETAMTYGWGVADISIYEDDVPPGLVEAYGPDHYSRDNPCLT